MSYLQRISLVALCLTFIGCATFRDGANPPIVKWPPDSTIKTKSIALRVDAKAIVNNQNTEVNATFLEKWREQVLNAYSSSGYFSTIHSGSETADILAEISILDKGDANMGLAFLSGFTMTMIPSKTREGFIVKTTYKDSQGNILGSLEKTEYADTWIQLFMFPLMPFYWPGSEYMELISDLNKNLIIDAHNKGIF